MDIRKRLVSIELEQNIQLDCPINTGNKGKINTRNKGGINIGNKWEKRKSSNFESWHGAGRLVLKTVSSDRVLKLFIALVGFYVD